MDALRKPRFEKVLSKSGRDSDANHSKCKLMVSKQVKAERVRRERGIGYLVDVAEDETSKKEAEHVKATESKSQ